MNIVGKKVSFFRHVDDTLGVFHTHTVAGSLGGFMVGIFANTQGSEAFALTTKGGAIERNGRQVWLQIVGALFIIALNIVMTTIILLFIKLFVPLRMPEEMLLVGDDAIHGESAYTFFDSSERSLLYGDTEPTPDSGDGEIGPTKTTGNSE
jgi:Amt family ammonium transporter